MQQSLMRIFSAVRGMRPPVCCLSPCGAMEMQAAVLRAVSAVPVLSFLPGEAEDLAERSSVLVLSTGTPDRDRLAMAEIAGRRAKELGRPVVLDPDGACLSPLRAELALRFLDLLRPCILRADAAEVTALHAAVRHADGTADKPAEAGAGPYGNKGVPAAADLLARRFGCVVAACGERDYVTDGEKAAWVRGGSPLMAYAAGMGSACSALAGAYAACAGPFAAAAAALAAMAAAGAAAGRRAGGPGSFVPAFLDALYAAEGPEAAGCILPL